MISRLNVTVHGFRVHRFRVQPCRWPEKQPVISKKKLMNVELATGELDVVPMFDVHFLSSFI
jgi:hypothetical protein